MQLLFMFLHGGINGSSESCLGLGCALNPSHCWLQCSDWLGKGYEPSSVQRWAEQFEPLFSSHLNQSEWGHRSLQSYQLQPRRTLKSCPWHCLTFSYCYLLISLWLCHSVHHPSFLLLRNSSGQLPGFREKIWSLKNRESLRIRPGALAAREEQDPERVVAQLDVTAASSSTWVSSEPQSGLKNANCLVKDKGAPGESKQLQGFWWCYENYQQFLVMIRVKLDAPIAPSQWNVQETRVRSVKATLRYAFLILSSFQILNGGICRSRTRDTTQCVGIILKSSSIIKMITEAER